VVEGGWLLCRGETTREPTFISELPKHVGRLPERQSRGGNDEIKLVCGGNEIIILAGAEIDQVIRQLTKRCSEAEQVMTLGLRLNGGLTPSTLRLLKKLASVW
jgi:hypothetical protein